MSIIQEIHHHSRDLLAGGKAECVIGYEVGPRGRTRPVFIYQAEDVERLTWNRSCTHNLTTYLHGKLKEPDDRVAVFVKACDSRTINVLLAENKLTREQVVVIGIACDGIEDGAGFGRSNGGSLQKRCQTCTERVPVLYDVLIGEVPEVVETAEDHPHDLELARLESLTPSERAEFWLEQFDRCIRCYACRQACPMCDCPTCLYESDDSLWVGMATRLSEKRTFHLGRAFHLAGRCVGCDECERVCPMDIPIGLLNRRLAKEIETLYGHQAGLHPVPSPITTILSEEVS
jgi:ferredoxin